VLEVDLPRLTATAGAGRVDFGRFVAVQMIDALAADPARMLGPRRPVADPGRALRVSGDLDKLVASGLGFDLAALDERASVLGMLGALEATSVPLAGTLGATKLDKAGLAALQGALQAELQKTLDVAAPPVVGKGPVGPRGARAAKARRAADAPDAPDALDLLIARAAGDADEEEPES
jgi:hypothetical protein